MRGRAGAFGVEIAHAVVPRGGEGGRVMREADRVGHAGVICTRREEVRGGLLGYWVWVTRCGAAVGVDLGVVVMLWWE